MKRHFALPWTFLCLTGLSLTKCLSAADSQSKQVSVNHLIQDLRNEFHAKLKSYDLILNDYKVKTKQYEERLNMYEARLQNTDNVTEALKQRLDLCEKSNVNRKDLERDSKRSAEPGQAAFYVELSSDRSNIGTDQTIVFDHVTTNIGQGYSTSDGEFTAPVTGVYVFIWTTTNRHGHHLQSELMVNGVVFGRQWSDSEDGADTGTATGSAVLSLNTGDEVWVRATKQNDGHLTGSRMSSFSGWVIS